MWDVNIQNMIFIITHTYFLLILEQNLNLKENKNLNLLLQDQSRRYKLLNSYVTLVGEWYLARIYSEYIHKI